MDKRDELARAIIKSLGMEGMAVTSISIHMGPGQATTVDVTRNITDAEHSIAQVLDRYVIKVEQALTLNP